MIGSLTRSSLASKKQYRSALAGNPLYTDFELIETISLTSTAATVEFSGIPQDYGHLHVRIVAYNPDSGTADLSLKINNAASAAQYRTHILTGTGDNAVGVLASSYANSSIIYIFGEAGTGAPCSVIMDIMDYTNTSKYKTMTSITATHGAATTSRAGVASGRAVDLAAITSLIFGIVGTSYSAGSRFSLYGVRK